MDTIKLPESSLDIQSGREVIVGLRESLYWMIDQNKEEGYDKSELLQRIRINTKDDTYLYNAVMDVVINDTEEDELKKNILTYRKSLKEYMSSKQVNTIIAQAFQKINFSGEAVNYRSFVRLLWEELEPFTHDVVDNTHPSVVDSVNFDDDGSLVDILIRSKDELSSAGVLKTGYQGINRMFGDVCGIRRGEFIVVGALQHQFKTGFTLNLFKQLALYNKPYMRDSTKKPLLVHISLENELSMNMLWLYANLKENETGIACDINSVDPMEAAKYIKARLQANGYHIEMLRIEPNQCNYYDFLDLLVKYEADGYEIHAVVCDYLNMLSKQGLDRAGPTGSEIRELFRRVRNFCAPRGTAFITPHQLSTDAKMLIRNGVSNFVQEIANKGYYDGCKTIDQEVDMEILIHIEIIPGKGSYLTCMRGKHRTVKITPIDDLYCVLPFSPIGGVRDDIQKDDLSMRSVGGKSMSQGGQEWFDL